MNPEIVEFLTKHGDSKRAAQMQITLDWISRHFDYSICDRFTKDGKGCRVGWMRKPHCYPSDGLPWHEVRGRYFYPEGR